MAGQSVKHGTASAYQRSGCRCEECNAWNAGRMRRVRWNRTMGVDAEFHSDGLINLPSWNERGTREWTERAACKGIDTSIFYPAPNVPTSPLALETCSQCPVKRECEEYADVNLIKEGIWGGKRRQRKSGAWYEKRKREQAAKEKKAWDEALKWDGPPEEWEIEMERGE